MSPFISSPESPIVKSFTSLENKSEDDDDELLVELIRGARDTNKNFDNEWDYQDSNASFSSFLSSQI